MKLRKKSKLLIIMAFSPIILFAKSRITSYLRNKRYRALRPPEEKRFGEKKDRDLIDESGWESFPCSDPPAHPARLD